MIINENSLTVCTLFQANFKLVHCIYCIYIFLKNFFLCVCFIEENKEGGDDANMTQVNGDILGNGATSQEDAEMEEGKISQ